MIRKFFYKNENVIAYNDFGIGDGFPVLVQHGSVASIKDIDLLDDLGKRARVICVARPGYGESSPYILNSFLDYGKIIAALLDELGISRFDILSSSAGAPYGYAAAKVCSEKIRNSYVYSGTPALYDSEVRANWPYPITDTISIEDSLKIAHEVFFSRFTEEDKKRNDIKDSMANNCFGEAQNIRIRFRDWGFTLAEIKSRVFMRHGKKDEILPYKLALRTAELFENCELELSEEGGHFSAEEYKSFVRNTVIENLGK